MCIEEKQIGSNYEIMMLLAKFNNKNKNFVNFKFYKGEIVLIRRGNRSKFIILSLFMCFKSKKKKL